ncbi:MAG: hypothetical protein Q9168_004575 [Polycauliona sp. 1 TL-2023]
MAIWFLVLLAYTHAKNHASLPSIKERWESSKDLLAPRADGDGGVGNDIKWTGMTSGDGEKSGKDSDAVWYIKDAIEEYTTQYPAPADRVGVFWGGGGMTQDDFDDIDEFIEATLGMKGKKFVDVFTYEILKNKGGINPSIQDNKYWRGVNRVSKALAASCSGGTAYVFMKPNGCRTLFSPPSQHPQDSDPAHGGQATNGEIWYYAELPTLMRNLNIQKIVTFYKTTRTPGNPPKFVQDTQWDVDRAGDKKRTDLADIAMDATPIQLPPEAGRGPLRKRQTAPDDTLIYQAGLFDVKTTSFAGLVSDSATICTATNLTTTITTTVPIWLCTACPTPYNAIFVSPVSVIGPPGIPSPPPGYLPLTAGSDMTITHVSLPTASMITNGDTAVNAYGATYRWPSPSLSTAAREFGADVVL